MKQLSEEKQRSVNYNIRHATRHANEYVKKYGRPLHGIQQVAMWNRVYHEEMDRLCKADGVRV
jgi:hypothetical protein